MTNIIIVSFKEETKAIDALHKLNELESYGDISIYEKIVVRKKENGEYEVLKEDSFAGWKTLAGMGIGSLVGLLGGPVGFIIGVYTGTAIGLIADASHFDFAEDFISKVENKMTAGTVSIIAEINEDSDVFIDNYMKPFGATVTRSTVDFEYDNYVDDQIEEIDEEIADARATLKKSAGDDKKKIEKKIDQLKTKRREKIAEIEEESKKKMKNIKDKTAAGVDKIKSGINELKDSISTSAKVEKAERIKRRIARHEAKLNDLNKELKELTKAGEKVGSI